MNIAKALKVKNRIAGELAQLRALFATENSRREDSASKVDRWQILDNAEKLQADLVSIKARIARASAPIAEKLAQLSEAKSQLAFVNTLLVKEHAERIYAGPGVPERVLQWNACLGQLEKLEKEKAIQAQINNLQDEIDEFNASTVI